MAPLGGRPDHPAKWVLLKDDARAMRFIIRHGPLFQDNKGAHRHGTSKQPRLVCVLRCICHSAVSQELVLKRDCCSLCCLGLVC